METLKTLLIACVPAVISGIISFILAKSQSKAEVQKLKLANEHEFDKLMEQHKIDIDAIREQHRLEMELKKKIIYTSLKLCKRITKMQSFAKRANWKMPLNIMQLVAL